MLAALGRHVDGLHGGREKDRPRPSQAAPVAQELPRFYAKARMDSDLGNLVLEEARQRFLDAKDAMLPDDSDLDTVFNLLLEYSIHIGGETPGDRIDYVNFCRVGDLAPIRTKCFFTPSNFAMFKRDEHVRINSGAFYHFVVRKVSIDSNRITMTTLDERGTGFLTEADLERYIFDEIPDLAQLSSLEEEFYPFYVFTACRYIFFMLDPAKKGRIRISDLITSPILKELSELRHPLHRDAPSSTSWLSAQSALRVYSLYLSLDKDQNGMLSKSELLAYNDGAFTPLFVDRIFQEYRTYDGEMDYKRFLDLVLALEQKKTPSGLRYFWTLLDVNKCGYITLFNINLFFRAVIQKLVEYGIEPVHVEDVINEIFDMVKPKNPYRITLKDLANSCSGDTVVSILTDVNAFWAYDNRESLSQESDA